MPQDPMRKQGEEVFVDTPAELAGEEIKRLRDRLNDLRSVMSAATTRSRSCGSRRSSETSPICGV